MVTHSEDSFHLRVTSWLFLDVRIVSRIAVSLIAFCTFREIKLSAGQDEDLFDGLLVIELGLQEIAGVLMSLLSLALENCLPSILGNCYLSQQLEVFCT